MMDWIIPIAVCLLVAVLSYRLGCRAATNTLARKASELVAVSFQEIYDLGHGDGMRCAYRERIEYRLGEGDQ